METDGVEKKKKELELAQFILWKMQLDTKTN